MAKKGGGDALEWKRKQDRKAKQDKENALKALDDMFPGDKSNRRKDSYGVGQQKFQAEILQYLVEKKGMDYSKANRVLEQYKSLHDNHNVESFINYMGGAGVRTPG